MNIRESVEGGGCESIYNFVLYTMRFVRVPSRVILSTSDG